MSDKKKSKVSGCNACGGLVSNKVKKCPHCGEKRPLTIKKQVPRSISWSLIGLVFFYGILLIKAPNQTSHQSPQTNSNGNEYKSLCTSMIRKLANNPSTVKIQAITGYASKTTDGVTYITQEFSAKNAYGLKKNMIAYCIGKNGMLDDIKIKERDY